MTPDIEREWRRLVALVLEVEGRRCQTDLALATRIDGRMLVESGHRALVEFVRRVTEALHEASERAFVDPLPFELRPAAREFLEREIERVRQNTIDAGRAALVRLLRARRVH